MGIEQAISILCNPQQIKTFKRITTAQNKICVAVPSSSVMANVMMLYVTRNSPEQHKVQNKLTCSHG